MAKQNFGKGAQLSDKAIRSGTRKADAKKIKTDEKNQSIAIGFAKTILVQKPGIAVVLTCVALLALTGLGTVIFAVVSFFM